MTEPTTRTINIGMPEPGTPEYENFRQYMRGMYADPRQVNFRASMRTDKQNMAFLTQGDTDPLPEITEPLREAVEIKVTLLLDEPLNFSGSGYATREDAEYELMKEVEKSLRGELVAGRYVIDVLLPEEPREVLILHQDYYREGDHFNNPIKREGDTDGDTESV